MRKQNSAQKTSVRSTSINLFPPSRLVLLLFFSAALILVMQPVSWAANQAGKGEEKQPEFSISKDLGDAASRQAGQLGRQIQEQTRSLFRREPLGFDLKTARYLYQKILALPSQLPNLMEALVEQSRLLGF